VVPLRDQSWTRPLAQHQAGPEGNSRSPDRATHARRRITTGCSSSPATGPPLPHLRRLAARRRTATPAPKNCNRLIARSGPPRIRNQCAGIACDLPLNNPKPLVTHPIYSLSMSNSLLCWATPPGRPQRGRGGSSRYSSRTFRARAAQPSSSRKLGAVRADAHCSETAQSKRHGLERGRPERGQGSGCSRRRD
jgi:hypothetical protein